MNKTDGADEKSALLRSGNDPNKLHSHFPCEVPTTIQSLYQPKQLTLEIKRMAHNIERIVIYGMASFSVAWSFSQHNSRTQEQYISDEGGIKAPKQRTKFHKRYIEGDNSACTS